jgi:hypothetical protein
MRSQRITVGTANLRRTDGSSADLTFEVLLKFRAATSVLHVFVNGKPAALVRAKLRPGGHVDYEAALAPERDWPLELLNPQDDGSHT